MTLNIKQSKLDEALEVVLPNRLKLREKSRQIIEIMRQNVPYILGIVSKVLEVAKNGNSRPINVKDNMIENIIKHRNIIDLQSNNINKEESKLSEEVVVDNNISEVNETKVDEQNINTEIKAFEPKIAEYSFNYDNNFDTKIANLSNIRNGLLAKKEEASLTEQQLEASNKAAQESAIRLTEEEKAYQADEEKMRKVLKFIDSHAALLNEQYKPYEQKIAEDKEKIEQNNSIIAENQNKTDNLITKRTELNDNMANIFQELSNYGIYENDVINFYNQEAQTDEEEVSRRIA